MDSFATEDHKAASPYAKFYPSIYTLEHYALYWNKV